MSNWSISDLYLVRKLSRLSCNKQITKILFVLLYFGEVGDLNGNYQKVVKTLQKLKKKKAYPEKYTVTANENVQ